MKNNNYKMRTTTSFSRLLICLLFITGLWTLNSFGQNANTYLFSTTASGAGPLTIGTPTTLVGPDQDDGVSAVTNIGFPFVYEGITYTQFSANTNGLVRLGSTVVTNQWTNSSTENVNIPKLMMMWDDLYSGTAASGGGVFYELQGTGTSHKLLIEWHDVNIESDIAVNIIMQAVLYETTNVIEFRFGTGVSGFSSATCGIGGLVNTNFNVVNTSTHVNSNVTATDGNTAWPGSGRMYTFSPPPPCTTPANQPTVLNLTPVGSSSITGSFTAAAGADAYLVVRYPSGGSPTNPVDGTTYTAGNALGTGTVVASSASTSFVATGLTGLTTYDFKVYSINNLCGGGPKYLTTSPLVNSATTLAATTSTAQGGLWSSPATWGGAVPGVGEVVIIADGATVLVDVSTALIGSLTLGQGTSGVLEAASGVTLNVSGNILINAGARFFPHNSTPTGITVNIGGNFTNNGTASLAAASSQLNFNGSQVVGGSLSQTLGGTGTFIGDGTKGIIRSLRFQTTGSSTISTTQNLICSDFAHTAGSLNTNGKLTIDNTAQVYGQAAINNAVQTVNVTSMGVAYSNQPVVFGSVATLWVAGATSGATGSRVFFGNNVYTITAGGGTAFDATTGPSHTYSTAANGGTTLLWVGTLGTIGTPLLHTALTQGTVYFYGPNLYVMTNTPGTIDPLAPPIHTSGSVTSGTANLRYVGTAATVSVNYDATTQTVRSLTLTNPGSGYTTAAPNISFSTNGGTVTTAAVASAVIYQQIAGPTNALTQKSGSATITGGLTINSTQGASAASGVGAITTANGGVNYTVAPTIGFAGPTAINLVTANGSGYATNPTITVTGGTLISGTALTTSNFTITCNQGQVVSVYLNASTTACYSVPPTLAFSAGTATLAFPAGCWPTATASIGANGQLTNFTVTNAGFGYVVAPTLGIGTTSGVSADGGGTFSVVATTPTARIALYNLTYNNFAPSASNVANPEGAEVPSNRKINALAINSPGIGANFTGNLEIFASSAAFTPLTLGSGKLNMGGNNLLFSWNGYAGTTGSVSSSVTNGSITLTTRGGGNTGSSLSFPFDATFSIFTGSGTTAANGSSVVTVTASRDVAPTGSVTPSGTPIGTRSYRAVSNAGSVYGTNPTVTLNWNGNDALNSDQSGLFVTQSTATGGPWAIRSTATGTLNASLATTGSRTTATSGSGPIVPTGNDLFAWATTYSNPALQYNIVRNTGTSYSSIIGAGGQNFAWVSTSNDDNTAPAVTIPGSTFQFQGQLITGFQVCTNGWIHLISSSSPATTITTFSNNFAANGIGNLVAAFWDDLTSPGYPSGGIATLNTSTQYKFVGTQIIIEYQNYSVFGAVGPQLSWQVVLDQADNSITINYGLFQGFNGTNDHHYTTSIGLGAKVVNAFPAPGQLLAQQYENSDVFSNGYCAVANAGSNSLMSIPECNSSIKFTPGAGYTGGTIPSTAPPVNDDPFGGEIVLTALSAFPSNLCGNFYTSRYATATNAIAACNGNNDDDVWFKFVAVDPNTQIKIYGSGGYRPTLEVLDASLNPLSPVSCSVGPSGGSTVTASIVAVPGNTYFCRVYHNGGGVQAQYTANFTGGAVTGFPLVNAGSGYTTTTTGSFTTARVRVTGGGGSDAVGTANLTAGTVSSITLQTGGYGYTSAPTVTVEQPNWAHIGEFAIVVFAQAANDECATATTLTNINNTACTAGQNAKFGVVTSAASASAVAACNGTPDDDVWYKFDAVAANTTVTVIGHNGYDPTFEVFDGGVSPGACAGTSISCIHATGADGTEQSIIPTTVGHTYYVRVYHGPIGSGGVGASFDICIKNSLGDAALLNVYSLGKLPIDFGANHIIKARIRNTSTIALVSLPVTLTITGDNSFTNTQNVTLNPGDSATVVFAPFTPFNVGLDTIKVTVPNDDNLTNNLVEWDQEVTLGAYSYKDPSIANAGGLGFNGFTGHFVSKFRTDIDTTINEVRIDFVSTGNPYTLVIYDDDGAGGAPGTQLYESGSFTTLIGTDYIQVPNIFVSGGFYVGVHQTSTVNVAYAYQNEVPVIRSGEIWYLPFSGLPWVDLGATPQITLRPSIQVNINVPTIPNCAENLSPAFGTSLCLGGAGLHLSWNSGGGAPTGYDVYFDNILLASNWPLENYDIPSGTATPGNHTWRIEPQNSYGIASGCSNQSVTVLTTPTVGVTPTSSTAGCATSPTPVTLTASGADTYTWNPTAGLTPASGSPVSAAPTATTVYTVTGTLLSSGCTATATATVTVNPAVIVSPTATPSAICTGGTSQLNANASGGAGPGSPTYCAIGNVTFGACGSDEYISNITFGSINSSSACTLPSGYTDFTAQSTNLTVGPTTVLTATIGTFYADDSVVVWIDFNRNGNFNDPGEKFYTTQSGGGSTFTTNIVVPPSAYNGASRMRVRLTYAADADPCLASDAYGEVEDYTVVISGGAAAPVANFSYAWTPPTFLNNTNTANPTASGVTATTTYTVTVTDLSVAGGCSATGSVTVSISPLSAVSISGPPPSFNGAYSLTPISGQTYAQLTGGGITVVNTNAQLTAGMGSGTQDDAGVVITLPFTFTYNGNTFTQMSMCTNGWVGAGNQGTIDALNMRIPGNLFTSTIPNNTLAAWFKDMGANFPVGPGSMRHGLIGTDVYAFQWDQANGSGFGDGSTILISFQINIYGPASATPGRIEYIYGPTVGAITFASSIGIEDAAGGTNHYINALNGSSNSTVTSTVWPGNGSGYRFDPLGATSLTVCVGDSVLLTSSVTGGGLPYTYNWSSGATTATTYVHPVGGTNNYTLTVTDACTNSLTSNTVTITGIAPPNVTITNTRPLLSCNSDPVILNATGATSYTWAPATGLSATTGASVTATPTATTLYTVTGTSGTCTDIDTITVFYSNLVLGSVTADQTTGCAPFSTTLHANVVVASYCTPVYTNSDGTDFIDTVKILDAAGTTVLFERASGQVPLPGYDNQTSLPTTTLAAGSTYRVYVGVNAGGFTETVGVYLDYLANGNFTDASETLIPVTTIANGGASLNVSFTVPAGALNGTARLRFAEKFSSNAEGPCVTSGFGETEDYTVTISGGVPPPPTPFTFAWSPSTGLSSTTDQNPTVTGLAPAGSYPYTVTVSNAAGCSVTGTVTLTVTNCGQDTLHVTAFLQGPFEQGIIEGNPGFMTPLLYNLMLNGFGSNNDVTATDTIHVNLWANNDDSLAAPDPGHSAFVILHIDGSATAVYDPASLTFSGAYWVAVKSRNHIETWSKTPVTMGSSVSYNFTNAQIKAYDDGVNPPMKALAGGAFGFYGGDINQDGGIDGNDMNFIDNNPGGFGYDISDINMDMGTDGNDMNFVDNNGTLGLFYARPYAADVI